jgi:hypothetical protein
MKKSQLAKMFLSNPEIVGGKLRFDYVNPLDELLKIVGGQGWWRKRDISPKIFLQFAARALENLPELLVA